MQLLRIERITRRSACSNTLRRKELHLDGIPRTVVIPAMMTLNRMESTVLVDWLILSQTMMLDALKLKI